MITTSDYVPESALAIFAHPDDIEFTCAGTLALWALAGARLSYVICTSGEAGVKGPYITKTQAAAIREAEQRAAADIVGAKEVVFLREPDGLLQPTLELRKRLVREIRRLRPEVLVTGDPTVVFAGDYYINHPDHRAAAEAALAAAFPAASQPLIFEDLSAEGLVPHKVRKVYCANRHDGTVFVDIGATMDLKIVALRAHVSQVQGWDVEKNLKNWAAERARYHEMEYAEIFRVITLESDADWLTHKGAVIGRE